MTADVKQLPLPEADGFMESFDTYGCPVGTEDAWAEETVKDYARANVYHTTAAKNAELVELRSAIEALREEVNCANGWNERVSVCRDHVADIVDGPCVICALNAAKARAQQLATVDEAMVERAVAAVMSAPPGISVETYVRIVLEAALATQHQEPKKSKTKA